MRLSSTIVSYIWSSTLCEARKKPFKAVTIAISAIPAVEMAFRSLINLYQLSQRKEAELQYKTGGYLIGACLLTPCAMNAFPGARESGAIAFILYATRTSLPHSLLSSWFIHIIHTKIVSPLLQVALKIGSLALEVLAFIKKRIVICTVIGVVTYLSYVEGKKRIPDTFYRETALKARDMFSKVWPSK